MTPSLLGKTMVFEYNLSFDFTAFQAGEPSTPLPSDKIEIEFQNISTAISQINQRATSIQRSDGTLLPGVVTPESLATELTIGLRSPVAWTNNAQFEENDTVIDNNRLYRAVADHTSNVFVSDLANGLWVFIADYGTFTQDAQQARDDAQQAAQSAIQAMDNIENTVDDFDDRYLGPFDIDPLLDNDGDQLEAGSLYWNLMTNSMRVYNGSSWTDAIGGTSLPIFTFTAVEGQTAVSGPDDFGTTLFYTVDKFMIFVNGVNITRFVTATNGTVIANIPVLSLNDIVEVYSFQSVVVLEDISTHSERTPIKDDYLLFQDTDDGDLDRRAKIEDILLVDGVIPNAPSATPTLLDQVLFGDVSDEDATKRATLAQLLALVDPVPTGAVLEFYGTTPPNGYAWANGQELSRTVNAALFAVFGTRYGAGNGSTTFNVIDKRGRVGAGVDDMGGTPAGRLTGASGFSGELGSTSGSEQHQLATGEMPQHTHDISGLSTSEDFVIASGGIGPFDTTLVSTGIGSTRVSAPHSHTITGTLADTGNSNAHNNVQPTILCNYIVRL